jgi:hypothetical protein
LAKIVDINKHGIRREIDHQYKPKKRTKKSYPQVKKLSTDDIDISIDLSTDAPVMGANNVKRGN